MTDVMYEIPSEDDIKECVITKEAVLDGESPKLIMEDNETKLLHPVKMERVHRFCENLR